MFTKFASYEVPPVMVSTHGSVVPLAMFFLFFSSKRILFAQVGKICVLSVSAFCDFLHSSEQVSLIAYLCFVLGAQMTHSLVGYRKRPKDGDTVAM